MKQRIEYIEWRDSSIFNTQEYIADIDLEICVFKSVGFFIKEDSQAVFITRDTIRNDIRGGLIIPKENIVKRKKLFIA